MSIGLYDMDMATYTVVCPNLEIMKLSTYYKRRREVVVLSPTFSPERNSKFFLRKDYDDGNYPKNISAASYGGLAFTNNIYQPLDLEIEKCSADPHIYDRYQSAILKESTLHVGKKLIHDILTGEHLRLSLDGKTIWEDYPKQFKKLYGAKSIIFHDYDLAGIEGSNEEVRKIIARATNNKVPVRIGMKFPLQLYTTEQLMKWSSLPTNGVFFGIVYHGMLSNEDFCTYAQSDFDRAAFSLTKFNVTDGWKDEQEFVKYGLPNLLIQAIISRIHNTRISLTYDTNFFFDERWGKVIELFSHFIHGAERCYKDQLVTSTLYDYTQFTDDNPFYKENYLSRNQIRDIYRFVQKNDPELFSMFYNCNYLSLRGTGLQ